MDRNSGQDDDGHFRYSVTWVLGRCAWRLTLTRRAADPDWAVTIRLVIYKHIKYIWLLCIGLKICCIISLTINQVSRLSAYLVNLHFLKNPILLNVTESFSLEPSAALKLGFLPVSARQHCCYLTLNIIRLTLYSCVYICARVTMCTVAVIVNIT